MQASDVPADGIFGPSVQVHSATKHVEYRGEIMTLSESLLQLPAGGQVVLSDTTFQRIGGRLHEVKLPSLDFQKLSHTDGQPKGKGDRQRDSLDGKPGLKVEGQGRPEGQPAGQSPPASSRRSSMDTTGKQAVMQAFAVIQPYAWAYREPQVILVHVGSVTKSCSVGCQLCQCSHAS